MGNPTSLSSYSSYNNNYHHRRKGSSSSCRAMAPHFLDSCFHCKALLHAGDDIYMYKGDTPFCSEECRQQQIEADEAKERSNMKKVSNKLKPRGAPKSCEVHARAAPTVVAG